MLACALLALSWTVGHYLNCVLDKAFLFAVGSVFAFGGLWVDQLLFSCFCGHSSRWAFTFSLEREVE